MSGNKMKNLFNGIYRDKTVLVTGHTGFKGSWLSLWLKKVGAKVIGYALEPPTEPNHFNLLSLDMNSIIGDIRDSKKLTSVFKQYRPDIIFHLAAQPLVKESYKNPYETYETNVMGTVNLFEAVKKSKSIKAVLNITSDKCYENKEWFWGYRENDPMGGYDPYSSSKGCSELVTAAYRRSFFNMDDYRKKHYTLLASCRAGNVIGGGDWANDRLIPDIVKAAAKEEKVKIRSPYSIRPWQHVLESLRGYLLLGQKLLEGKKNYVGAWNFGPSDYGNLTVMQFVKISKKYWPQIDYKLQNLENQFHESNLLKLDCSKAYTRLKWKNVWNVKITLRKTIEWYKNYYQNSKINSVDDLNYFVENTINENIEWS